MPGNEAALWLLEDSEEDAETFCFAAAAVEMPARIRHFKSGAELLGAMGAETAKPALIVLDLNLPGLDGRDLLARLKQSPDHHAVPLLVLSSSPNQNDITRAYEAGACAYLVKPLGLERYEELLRSIKDFWFGKSLRPLNGS